MTDYPKYDPNEKCPKCGGRNGPKYNRYIEHVSKNEVEIIEQLITSCLDCGYWWYRSPLDAED